MSEDFHLRPHAEPVRPARSVIHVEELLVHVIGGSGSGGGGGGGGGGGEIGGAEGGGGGVRLFGVVLLRLRRRRGSARVRVAAPDGEPELTCYARVERRLGEGTEHDKGKVKPIRGPQKNVTLGKEKLNFSKQPSI